MEGLVEGRIVHFVLDKFVNEVEASRGMESFETEVITCRPAIIVNAWGGRLEDGMVNLQVFLDGPNDNNAIEHLRQKRMLAEVTLEMTDIFKVPATLWQTSAKYSESKEVGTWHWPERN